MKMASMSSEATPIASSDGRRRLLSLPIPASKRYSLSELLMRKALIEAGIPSAMFSSSIISSLTLVTRLGGFFFGSALSPIQ